MTPRQTLQMLGINQHAGDIIGIYFCTRSCSYARFLGDLGRGPCLKLG